MTSRKISAIILGTLMIILGASCLFSPDYIGLSLGYIIGFSMVIDGIGRIVHWFSVRKFHIVSSWALAGAIISLLFGIVLIASAPAQLIADQIVAILAAVWLVALGIVRITRSIKVYKIRKEVKNNVNGDTEFGIDWWLYLILGILLVVYGIICIIYPIVSLTAIGIFIGIGIVVSGINLIALGTSPYTF